MQLKSRWKAGEGKGAHAPLLAKRGGRGKKSVSVQRLAVKRYAGAAWACPAWLHVRLRQSHVPVRLAERASTPMQEEGRIPKPFIGGVNIQIREKARGKAFGKYGPSMEGEGTEDTKAAVKDVSRKSLHGKASRLEEGSIPSSESGGRLRETRSSRNTGRPRNVTSGRGGSGDKRGNPARGRHLDAGIHTLHLNTSSSRALFPVNRGSCSRRGSPSPKRSARSDAEKSHGGMERRGPVAGGRKKYGSPRRRESVSSRGKDSSSRDYPRSRDDKDYASQHGDSACHGYGHSSSRSEHSSKRQSDRGGCGGSRDGDYCEHSSAAFYQDWDESFGNSRGVPPERGLPLTYGGRGRYDECSAGDGYGGHYDNYSRSYGNAYFRFRKRSGRRDREYSPSVPNIFVPSESCSGSSSRLSSRDCIGSKCERGPRKRY